MSLLDFDIGYHVATFLDLRDQLSLAIVVPHIATPLLIEYRTYIQKYPYDIWISPDCCVGDNLLLLLRWIKRGDPATWCAYAKEAVRTAVIMRNYRALDILLEYNSEWLSSYTFAIASAGLDMIIYYINHINNIEKNVSLLLGIVVQISDIAAAEHIRQSLPDDVVIDYQFIFNEAYSSGRLEVVEWCEKHFGHNCRPDGETPCAAARGGNLQLLESVLAPTNTEISTVAACFRDAIEAGKLEAAKWIAKTYPNCLIFVGGKDIILSAIWSGCLDTLVYVHEMQCNKLFRGSNNIWCSADEIFVETPTEEKLLQVLPFIVLHKYIEDGEYTNCFKHVLRLNYLRATSYILGILNNETPVLEYDDITEILPESTVETWQFIISLGAVRTRSYPHIFKIALSPHAENIRVAKWIYSTYGPFPDALDLDMHSRPPSCTLGGARLLCNLGVDKSVVSKYIVEYNLLPGEAARI